MCWAAGWTRCPVCVSAGAGLAPRSVLAGSDVCLGGTSIDVAPALSRGLCPDREMQTLFLRSVTGAPRTWATWTGAVLRKRPGRLPSHASALRPCCNFHEQHRVSVEPWEASTNI